MSMKARVRGWSGTLLLAGMMLLATETVLQAEVGPQRPLDIVFLPDTESLLTLRLYDLNAGRYIQEENGVTAGSQYELRVPAWDRWYWIGVWMETTDRFIWGQWIGHFRTMP
jgi:hypothetical protein